MRCVLTFLFLLIACLSYSRNTDTTVTSQENISISDQVLHRLGDQYGSLDKSIKNKTGKMLERLQKNEAKLQKKVAAKDSVKAKEIFVNSSNRYQALQTKLQQPIDKTVANPLREYIPNMDSLQTAFRFLERNSSKLPTGQLQQIQAVSNQLQQLQGRLQQANEIQTFIRQREQQLKDQLSQYGGDVSKQLLGMNKQVYYYQQQLVEYKALLKDKQQMEQKALSAVRELPAFQSFMQKNSYLAQLFPSAENYSSSQALSTMQLRAQVQTMIQSRLGMPVTTNAGDLAAGSSGEPEQFMGQQIGQAQSVMSSLKDKVSNSGGSSSEITMPDFSPNGQKTKSFFKRLEYGFNIQSQRSNYLLPTTSQFAATIGYLDCPVTD